MDKSLSRTVSAESTRSWQQLTTASGSTVAERKARSSEPETGGGAVSRASVSMPPSGSSAIRQMPSRRPSQASGNSILELFGHARSGSNGSSAIDEMETTPTLEASRPSLAPVNALMLPDAFRPPRSDVDAAGTENKRLSFSSLYSIGSAIFANTRGHSWSGRSSVAGSEPEVKMDGAPHTTTATTSLSVTTSSQNGSLGPKVSPTQLLFPHDHPSSSSSHPTHMATPSAPSNASSNSSTAAPPAAQPRRSRSRTAQRRISGSTAPSSSPASRDMRERKPTKGIIGVCALESKARSKPARNIFGKLVEEFEVKIFGDKIILDESVENWPVCDFLISFFSDGFPLDKAIAYVRLRKPFCVNDLPMQQVLWDRRLCLGILDKLNVPTPRRIDVSRDGGPRLQSAEFAKSLFEKTGLKLEGPEDGTGGGVKPPQKVELVDNGNAIRVDGVVLEKPFVEKPVSGEDHNIHIYFHKKDGGGGRRLFRKVNNKSSEKDDTLEVPRSIRDPTSSYIYEQFLQTENSEDVKAYTVGEHFCHAETRKSPVVDGLVKRNPSGKEVRYVTKLNDAEASMAARISKGFGQRVCGFDLLRTDGQSFVIDVNGWSFVKDNGDYYDRAANILKDMFLNEIQRKQRKSAAQNAAADLQDGVDRSSTDSRKNNGDHRKVFGRIFKSPSMSKMANHYHAHSHLPHMRHASTMPSSPETSLSPTPIAASPSHEKPNPTSTLSPPAVASLPDKPSSEPDIMLPPASVDEEPQLGQRASHSEDQVNVPPPASAAQWKLKGVVSVIRHADRTPKQKFKYTFHSKPFVDLLKGHQAEVLLIGEAALQSVNDAVKVAMEEKSEDPKKLRDLQLYLSKKGAWPGTKVQIKPMFRKRRKEELLPGETMPESSPDRQRQASVGEGNDGVPVTGDEADIERLKNRSDSMSGVTLSRITAQDNNMVLDKLQLIIKWGGEPTHSARHQTQDMGANFRNDLLLMNRDVLEDVHIFSSSERRVTTSAQIFGASFLDRDQYLAEHISVRKDLLDDSNAAKDVMDKVKKKLKTLLRAGNQAPPQFAWPKDEPDPYIVARQVVDLMKFHQRVMNHNFKKIESEAISSLSALASPPSQATTPGQPHQHTNVNHIQSRWCCNEGPELFKERWEKLFKEFADADKVDPSKISELYDTMKFDALHNRAFLEWVFTPDATFVDEESIVDVPKQTTSEQTSKAPPSLGPSDAQAKADAAKEPGSERPLEHRSSLSHRIGFRRKSEITIKPPAPPSYVNDSYFKLYTGVGTAASKAQMDARLVKLREMYHLCKVLFDYIGPQEYGIESEEKLEIGLLTSLPLLKEIVGDLEEMQACDTPKCFFYFTKESHIYTLLNCILEGGIKTKIERNKIPELDYLSQINFELYESENASTDDQPHSFNYSIRITLSPGCHAFSPLDVQLDSRHMIGFSPRRSLTAHQDWKEVLETLRAKFHTVKLPKSFVAIDLSEKVIDGFDRRNNGKGKEIESKSEDGERGRSEERDAVHIPIADEQGVVPAAVSPFAPEERRDGREGGEPAGLPPPAVDT